MTATVRYGALAGLIVLTGLLAWFIAAPRSAPDRAQAPAYTVEAREQVPELGSVGAGARAGPRPRRRRPRTRRPRDSRRRGLHGGVLFLDGGSGAGPPHGHPRPRAALEALRTGFLGRLTRGEFTAGAEIYP